MAADAGAGMPTLLDAPGRPRNRGEGLDDGRRPGGVLEAETKDPPRAGQPLDSALGGYEPDAGAGGERAEEDVLLDGGDAQHGACGQRGRAGRGCG